MEYISKSVKDTGNLGKKIASMSKEGAVFCLYGDLGVGKTVFARSFINYFIPAVRVLSPSYIIVRHYKTNKKEIKEIIHLDLYRLEKKTDIDKLGIFELFEIDQALVLIEWADRLGEKLPSKRTDIHFNYLKNNQRSIKVSNNKE